MNAEEFEKQFADEVCELVVRITWCWSKKSAAFQEEDGLCHARARFDQALDVQTGEIGGKGLDNWLEWLTPKKRFGFPYGYAFEKGHLYRVLVRPAREVDNAQFRSYCIEQLLESDVTEPRLDPYQQFAQEFEEAEEDRWLLIENDAFGWANVFDYRRAGVRVLAEAQTENDEPRACTGTLIWMEKAKGSGLKTTFGELSTCHVRVRRSKTDPSHLMLVKLVSKQQDPRFDALRKECEKPVVIASHLGTFTLNRHYDWYEGTIDYLGAPCDVTLSVDQGSTDASQQLARLEQLHENLAAIDRSVRDFAAQEMLDDAVDWCEEEVSHEQFMERMESPSINVEEDGSVCFAFEDGGLFAGHTIMVYMNSDGHFDEALIAG